jgi:hypothetical protein
MTRLLIAVLLVQISACKVNDPLYCDESTPCTDPALPFCDLGAEHPASEGIKRTCIPDPFPDAGPGGVCSPNEFLGCTDDSTARYCNGAGSAELSVPCSGACSPTDGCPCEPETTECRQGQEVVCGASGTVVELRACALGCTSDGARCRDVDPSNGLGEYLDRAAQEEPLVLTDGAMITTDDGQVIDGDGIPRAVASVLLDAPEGGVPVRVFMVRRLTLGGASITGTPAVAFVVHEDAEISGHVLLRSGRFTDASPCHGGASSSFCHGGLGGGGFGSWGGTGGSGRNSEGTLVSGSTGGSQAGNSTLEPLRGGCHGGAGKGGVRGGGALQLVSRTGIRVHGLDAILDANGGGGGALRGGFGCGPDMQASGGGSGGAILLEAPRVDVVAGAVVANGGGGGCYTSDGSPGQVSGDPASGAECLSPHGSGGNGAASTATSQGGFNAPATSGKGGGGGGGRGRIRINTLVNGFAPEGGAIVSPQPSVGAIRTR